MKQKQPDKIAVTEIKIMIRGKALSLTPEEMNELKDILNTTFPDPSPAIYQAPVIIERPYYRPRWREWDITWGTTTDGQPGQTMCLALTGGTAE